MKIGQKLVYIGSGGWFNTETGNPPTGPAPISKEIYTFDGVCRTSNPHIYFKELQWVDETGKKASWEAVYFRPVDDTFLWRGGS